MKSAYLKEVLLRQDCLLFEPITLFTNSIDIRDSLVDKIIDEMRGYYSRTQRFSNIEKFRIGALVVLAVFISFLFLNAQIFLGSISAVIEAIIAISELPDILKRQS
jgi:hypothetical protein